MPATLLNEYGMVWYSTEKVPRLVHARFPSERKWYICVFDE